jgi:hypothetical protein
VHRVRAAGLADDRVARLLGFPDSADPNSVRRALNRWEGPAARTRIDGQAVADLGHVRNRFAEAAKELGRVVPLSTASDDWPFRLLLDATDLDRRAARAIERFLSALLGVLEAEIRANVLDLPRGVMPGARPVTWEDVRERIAFLREQLAEADWREKLAKYRIAGERHRQVTADLARHPRRAEIVNIIAADPDVAAPDDALSRLWQEWTEHERPRRRSWPPRKQIRYDRPDPRLALDQHVAGGSLRVAAFCPPLAR